MPLLLQFHIAIKPIITANQSVVSLMNTVAATAVLTSSPKNTSSEIITVSALPKPPGNMLAAPANIDVA